MNQLTIRDYAQMAIVAALYVVLTITPPLNAISYGAYQFRISEMLNFLAFYHKKYIISITIGCMIANAVSSTSLGLIDVVVGGGSTLIFLSLGVYFFQRFKDQTLFKGQYNKAFFFFSIFFAISMITIAAELHYVIHMPFFYTWFTTGVGELASLLIGGYIMEKLSYHIDFNK